MAEIDLVCPWVDGSDPAWQQDRQRYVPAELQSGVLMYRDWQLMRYWFRGVERALPWIRKVHFVTWGHLPPWLNTEHPKLHVVRHDEFIPRAYLPTFSSSAIMLNIHRIPGLAEQSSFFPMMTAFIWMKQPRRNISKTVYPAISCISSPSPRSAPTISAISSGIIFPA